MEYDYIEPFLSDLNSQEAIDIVNNYTDDIVLREDVSDAQDFLELFSKALASQGAGLERSNPPLYENYSANWAILAFVAFMGLEQEEQAHLLRTRLLLAIQKGYDPSKLIFTYYNYIINDNVIDKYFKSFAKEVSQNNEQLGKTTIEIEGKKYMPEIRFWIQDYSKFPSKVAKRGNIERLNYINQSQNTKSLTQVYKNQLLKILKFYDELINIERPVNLQPEEDFRIVENRTKVIKTSALPKAESTISSVTNIDQKLQDLRTRVGR